MIRNTPLAAAISLLLAASPVLAQQGATVGKTVEPDATANATELDTVVVTGSNLKGIDLEGAQPVVVFDAQDIRELGANTVSDLLKNVTEAGGGTGNFTTANSGALQADSPVGSAGASLRGLGTASTLTLVNGRRIAVSSFANGSENFVDINAIPLAAVERVEILTTGASAIYGADAVAGVVNLILRSDFEGLRLAASYGDSTRDTDESRTDLSLVYGHQGERVRAMAILDAYQRNALYDRDRSISATEPRPSQQGVYPSFNDLDLSRDDVVEAGCPADQFGIGRFGEYCALNRNAFTATDPEIRQLGGYGTLEVDLTQSLRYFGELALQHNTSSADSSPAPWSEELIDFDHPGMPAELRQRLLDGDYVIDGLILGLGRFPDARRIEVTTDNWRWLNGLRGELGDWSWETALTASRSESEQRAVAGIYNVDRIRAGLLGELCADGGTDCAPDGGGLYYDPFNGQAGNSAQVLDLVRERVPRDGTSTLYGWDARFVGDWGQIDGRRIAWAVGGEARREKIEDAPSALATIDRTTGEVPVYGFGSTAVEAERTQWATYAETNLPLLDTLDLRVAGRYDHYDDFGGDFNPAVGLRWRPNDMLLMRGGWNTSFRAPSLAQVGAGTTLSSGAVPCSPGSEFFETYCAGFEGDDAYLSEVYGNPDLKPETAEAWYLGTVFALGPGTTLSIDYWNFDQENLVDIDDLDLFRRALVDPTLVFNSRPRAGDANQRELMPGVIGIATRGGEIGDLVDDVNLQLTNVGRQRTDGIDFSLEQRFEEGRHGRFNAYLDGTWTRSFERSESCSPGSVDDRRGAGRCGGDGQRLVERVGEYRYPEWLLNAGIGWQHRAWSARLWANHVDSFYDDDQRDGVPEGRRVASWTTLNLNVDWEFAERHMVGLNIRNLADRDPPVSLGSASNVDLYNHNTLGRFVTLNYVYRH
ncbi:TonB-dependent receptor [Marilutibacter aestuarii]|nr:TonB-dependent receptor [Lysobacter aestuarii]